MALIAERELINFDSLFFMACFYLGQLIESKKKPLVIGLETVTRGVFYKSSGQF